MVGMLYKHKSWLLGSLLLLSGLFSYSQQFSTDPTTFSQQVISILKADPNEAYWKVALDFEEGWNTKYTSAHQDTIMYITQQMRKKGYPVHPYLKHFYAYVALAVSQKGVQAAELSEILSINVDALHSLPREEYKNFLFEMNLFFGRGYLHMTRNTRTISEGGSYKFEMLGEYIPPDETIDPADDVMSDEEILQQELAQSEPPADPFADQPVSDPFATNSNPFGGNPFGGNPFGGSPFGNSGFGGAQQDEPANDPFATNNDSFDPFGANTTPEEPREAPAFAEEVSRQGNTAYVDDFVAIMQAQYPLPTVTGPVIHLDETKVTLVTPYDSLFLTNTTGTQLLKDKIFTGEHAEIDWPYENPRTRTAHVHLDQFYIRLDRVDFWTPNAKLTFSPYVNEAIQGVFRFRSQTRYSDELSDYPRFLSYYSDATFDIQGGDATYEGGIDIRGNNIYGNSLSKGINTLTISDGKGRQAVLTSRFFTLGDSLITTDNASFSFFHGRDSIYHPGVMLYYYPYEREMTVMVNKMYNVTPFHSTYHRMHINTEVMRWHMEEDSVDFDIISAKLLLPSTFASDDYFNDFQYRRMAGNFGFHPIAITVFFAEKFGTTDFNYADLVAQYKLNERLVYGAMVMLEQYNYIVFDEKSGHVTVLDKAFLAYNASSRKRDFDNLFIPSKLEGLPNASMNLDSMELLVRGVDRFYMTTDFKVGVKPEKKEVRILENRLLKFNGEIEAGDFDYKGHDFVFDYDAFLIDMATIDSIRLQIPLPDSLASEPGEKKALSNHLTETSGTLFLNSPDNRSNKIDSDTYPYFVSESEAIVYFDGPEVLDGAYDKSVRFIIPPLEVDDIDREDATTLQFPGVFNSGGIFPSFEDTLHIMPDNSLGFIHEIPASGYPLYGTPARTYENITLSSQGMRGQGKIDFLNTSVYSEDFIYYPDSVTADGYFGAILPGTVNNTSWPQAELGEFRMYWLPKKDSMFLRTTNDPIKFYNATAQLTGAANVTQKGVYGYGSLLTRGSIARSENLSFKEKTYAAQHATFTVLSDDPDKPAMAGDDISLTFDLTTNTADVHPEEVGVAAISFPYAQMKTSITNAKWFLEDSIIVMTRPDNVSLEDTYFYSTREELDSLAFNGDQAIYDIKKYELNVKGIPYILSADAEVVPDGNETTILANSKLQTFLNAELIFIYPDVYHYFNQGVIDIESRNNFSGSAVYQLPIEQDTFEIKMSGFYQEERILSGGRIEHSSTASGIVPKGKDFQIAAGFLYHGGVVFRAYKQALELEGYIKPNFKSLPLHDTWLTYERKGNEKEIMVDISQITFEDGEPVVAGLHYGSSGRIYHTFTEKRITPADDDFFLAKGLLSYNAESFNFKIEESGKSSGERYQGSSFIYSDTSQAVIFEGPASFMNPENNLIQLKSSVLGTGNRETNEFNIDAFLAMDLKLDKSVLDPMADDMIDIIERLGPAAANDLSLEAMLKLSNVIGEEATRKYERNSFKDYIPLWESSPELIKNIVISGVKMTWSNEQNAWYNTTKLAVSNLGDRDINAKLDGFLEFSRDDTGGEVMNLFIQAAPGSWYYFNYQENSLLVFSSNKALNEQIAAKSNYGNSKPGELTLILGDENETLKFLNQFLRVYFGVTEPYNLVYPDDVTLEDENFDTIEEEEDDGFGF